MIKKKIGENVVIYCFTKNRSKEISDFINQNLNNQSAYYHSDLSVEERLNISHKWVNNEIKIIVKC